MQQLKPVFTDTRLDVDCVAKHSNVTGRSHKAELIKGNVLIKSICGLDNGNTISKIFLFFQDSFLFSLQYFDGFVYCHLLYNDKDDSIQISENIVIKIKKYTLVKIKILCIVCMYMRTHMHIE